MRKASAGSRSIRVQIPGDGRESGIERGLCRIVLIPTFLGVNGGMAGLSQTDLPGMYVIL